MSILVTPTVASGHSGGQRRLETMDYGWGRALGATPPPTSQKANPDARMLTVLPVALALTVPER